jgi:hypothetical protein
MGEGNGQSQLTQRMVDVLERIEGGIKATNARLDTLHDDVVALRGELRSFKDETRGELTDIRGELREIRHEVADAHVRVTTTGELLEDRVRALEGAG